MNKQIKLLSLLLSFSALLFVACDDEPAVGTKLYPEEQIDMDAVKAYVSTGVYPVNNLSWTLYQTPKEILKPEKDTVSFFVLLSKKAEKDVQITLSDNPDLVASYNKENETNFTALPAGAIKVLTPTITIKAGEQKSAEKVQAVLDYEKVLEIEESALGCIAISQVSEGVKIAKTMNTVNLVLHKEFTNIKKTGSLDGATFVDNADFSITTETDFGGKWTVKNLTDGNIATSWIYQSGKGAYLLFNLNDAVAVKGFRTVPFLYDGFYGYNAKEVKIYTSTDGNDWKYQGVFFAPVPSSQAPIDIEFYEAVATKYIKIDILESHSAYVGYAEIQLAK